MFIFFPQFLLYLNFLPTPASQTNDSKKQQKLTADAQLGSASTHIIISKQTLKILLKKQEMLSRSLS